MAHIGQFLNAVAGHSPNKVLTVHGKRSKTAQQVKASVAALAAALMEQLNVQIGDVVVLALDSTDYFLECLLAVAAAGAISAPVNLRWSTTEAAAAINLCQANLILLDSASLHLQGLVSSSSCKHLQQAVFVDSRDACHEHQHSHSSQQLMKQYWGRPLVLRTAPEGAAIICFTSGTTGQPKGALISHTALHCQAMAKLLVVGYNAQDVYLHAAPLFHIGGLSSAIAVLMAGGTHVFMGRFDAADTLKIIADTQITSFIAVPAMIVSLTEAAAAAAAAATAGGARLPSQAAGSSSVAWYNSVQKVLVGAGGMSQHQVRRLQAVFPQATVHSAYGMTEACSSMTFKLLSMPHCLDSTLQSHRLRDARTAHAGPSGDSGINVGVPPPGIEMGVCCTSANRKHKSQAEPSSGAVIAGFSSDAHVCGVGEGELITRGPHTLLRYWGQPTETNQAFLPDKWLRTGDIGEIDAQGSVWLKGRLKDVIRTGSESVNAAEVEQVLTQHPAVLAAAVFGVPHPRFGEQVAAVLSLDGACAWSGTMLGVAHTKTNLEPSLTLASMQAFCRQANLSAYKLPRVVAAQYEPFPLNASGKVLKMQLKHAMLAALHSSGYAVHQEVPFCNTPTSTTSKF